MNFIHKISLLFSLAIALCSCSHAEMEKNFQDPSSEVKTAVYWYWISGNISKEGVIEDLKAMKRAGINRAFIGDIGQDGLYTERNVTRHSKPRRNSISRSASSTPQAGVSREVLG